MRQNKMIMRSLVLLGALFFWGNSFAQISLSVLSSTYKCNFLGADNKQ